MISKSFLPPLLIILMLMCAACIPTSTRVSTSPVGGGASGSQAMLDSAESAYSRGQYGQAADYYKSYLSAESNPPRLESILAAYGLSAEKAGRFSEAAGAYERLIGQFPAGEFAAEARPRLAGVYLAGGDAVKAEALASQLLPLESDAGRRNRLQLTLAESQWLRGQYKDAASNFLTVWRGSSDQIKTEARDGVLASLVRLDQTSLEEIQRQYGQNFPGAEATYMLTRLAAQAGDRDRTITLAEYFGRYFSTHALMTPVRELADGAGQPGFVVPSPAFGNDYDPRSKAGLASDAQSAPAAMSQVNIVGNFTIAVILPMSDKNAAQYAQEIVSGLKLAVRNFAPGDAIALSVMDTRGSDQEAARLVTQAAADPKVLAVIGPFLSRESSLAAQAANQAGLPLIAISQRTDLTGIGPNVFRLFLTPKHQAEAVARYAVRIQGHRDLGILYPADNYGGPIRDYFAAEVQRLGAYLAVADSYDPKVPQDWEEAVKRLTGGKVARKVSTSHQAETDFTALYLPDSAAVVAQILPHMAFYDVTRMQYLGSNLWLNQEFLTSSYRYVQGAVIPTAISDLSRRPESSRFIADFKSLYGHTPDQFAAYGYDAGLAVIQALGQGAATREELRRALSRGETVAGATGPFSFDSNGEYLIEPTLLTVKDRAFVLLREAGLSAR